MIEDHPISTTGPYYNASLNSFCGDCDIPLGSGITFHFPWTTTYSAAYITELLTINANGITTQTITNKAASARFEAYMTEQLALIQSEAANGGLGGTDLPSIMTADSAQVWELEAQ